MKTYEEREDSDIGGGPGASTKSTRLAACLFALVVVACGGKAKKPPVVVAPNVVLGDCVDPEGAGVVSERPEIQRANRDLNRDGVDELVLSDQRLCRNGNCYWNLFASREGCYRYIGTVEGSHLELAKTQSEQGFQELRSWWRLASKGRFLLQSYRFMDSGYRVRDVLVCRRLDDDRLQCAQEQGGEE